MQKECLPHREDKSPTTPSQFGWNMPWMVGKRVLPVKTYRGVIRENNFPPLMGWFLATSQISLLIFSQLRNWGRSFANTYPSLPQASGKAVGAIQQLSTMSSSCKHTKYQIYRVTRDSADERNRLTEENMWPDFQTNSKSIKQTQSRTPSSKDSSKHEEEFWIQVQA